MCHFTLELRLILNYSYASSPGKRQFKEASGMMLTSTPIKDSQEVWNKYKVQVWDILSESFPFSVLNRQSGKSPRILLCSGGFQDSFDLEILWRRFSNMHLRIPGHCAHCGKPEHSADGNSKHAGSETRTFPWRVQQRVNSHICCYNTAHFSSTNSATHSHKAIRVLQHFSEIRRLVYLMRAET